MRYDAFGRTRPLDVIGRCKDCGEWIQSGQPYEAVHRVGGGPIAGFKHQYCPPRLVPPTATGDPR